MFFLVRTCFLLSTCCFHYYPSTVFVFIRFRFTTHPEKKKHKMFQISKLLFFTPNLLITQIKTQGNKKCWGSGFDFNFCCDESFGTSGNSECWDDSLGYNYEFCCKSKSKTEVEQNLLNKNQEEEKK